MSEERYLLPVWDTIAISWKKMYGIKKSIWAAIGIIVAAIFLLSLVAGFLIALFPALENPIKFMTQIVTFLFQIGITYIGIRRAFDLPVSYRNLFRTFEFDICWRVILTYILQIIIFIPSILLAFTAGYLYQPDATLTQQAIAIGCIILSLVSFLYFSVRMSIAMGFVIDKKINPWPAIKNSFIATRGNIWRLIGLFLVQFLILSLCALPMGIGLIWGIPLMVVLYGVVYKSLLINVRRV